MSLSVLTKRLKVYWHCVGVIFCYTYFKEDISASILNTSNTWVIFTQHHFTNPCLISYACEMSDYFFVQGVLKFGWPHVQYRICHKCHKVIDCAIRACCFMALHVCLIVCSIYFICKMYMKSDWDLAKNSTKIMFVSLD